MKLGKKRRGKLGWFLVGLCGLAVFFAINWCYHAFHKPSEIIGLVDSQFFKNPKETWTAHGDEFQKYSTKIITPEFLAALAQTESQGNGIARTYWQWNFWTKNPFKVYSPASSAVGMLQMTDGTFDQAKHFCVIDGKVYTDTSKEKKCYLTSLYNRLIPSHSIEMTAAWLHWNVQDIINDLPKKKSKKITNVQKRKLAAVIHLCGGRRAEVFAARKFTFKRGETCGTLSTRHYVERVQKYEKLFRKINVSSRSQNLASF
jgi:hypothetical protein